MRTSHQEQIERWAKYVRSGNEWRKAHDEFINSLFQNHEAFLERILKTPKGKEKIAALYHIDNKKGYRFLE